MCSSFFFHAGDAAVYAKYAAANSGPNMSACGLNRMARPYTAPARIQRSDRNRQNAPTTPSVSSESICPHAPEMNMAAGLRASSAQSVSANTSRTPCRLARRYTRYAEARSAIVAGSLKRNTMPALP